MIVRIDETTAYEPDALVYCGEKLSPSAIEVPEPVIVVEVLLPSSRQVDLAIELAAISCCLASPTTSSSIRLGH